MNIYAFSFLKELFFINLHYLLNAKHHQIINQCTIM